MTFGQSCQITPSGGDATITITNTSTIDAGSSVICNYQFPVVRTGTYTGNTRVTFTPNSGTAADFTLNQSGNVIQSTSLQGACSGISGTVSFTYLNNGGQPVTGAACTFVVNVMLPVELATFSATPGLQHSVSLKWTTLSETNNEGFEIQRSYDAQDWEYVDFVAGQGTSHTAVDYEYQDHFPFAAQQIYYRLKQMDQDSVFEYSPVINVPLNGDSSPNLKIYPNPTVETLNIVSQAGMGTLFNTTGQPLRTQQLQTGTTNINISDLPAGTYILQLELENGERQSERFIKGK